MEGHFATLGLHLGDIIMIFNMIIIIFNIIIILNIIIINYSRYHPDAAFPTPPCTESPRDGWSQEHRSGAQGLEGTQLYGCWGLLGGPGGGVRWVTSHPGVQPTPGGHIQPADQVAAGLLGRSV